jgi:NADPH:quinone reductase-like Zn-dependent oxidoreductase
VCSTAKVELVRSIGADDVIDYLHEDFAEGPRDYELILDTAGNRPLSQLRRVLTARGTLVIIGGESGGHWSGGMDLRLRALMLSPFVGQKLLGFRPAERSEDLVVVRDFIEAGKLVPIIDRTYPLSETAEAISHARRAHASGKVVITI